MLVSREVHEHSFFYILFWKYENNHYLCKCNSTIFFKEFLPLLQS